MLETIRKHHYILMLFIAILICVAFVFFSDTARGPGQNPDGKALFTVGGVDYHRNELSQLNDQLGLLGSLTDSRNPLEMLKDPLAFYAFTLGGGGPLRRPAIVQRYGMTGRDTLNLDFCLNVATLRSEAKKLGIFVEREDLVKFVQSVRGFQTSNQFDSAKYEAFLNSGVFGDRTNTERRLFTALRDVMLFERVNQLIGGGLAPSAAEVDAAYARDHQKTTAAFALVEKSKQTPAALPEDAVQKFYDQAKADFEAHTADPAKPAPDPLLLSAEKRSVRYVLIKFPAQPPVIPAPQPEDTASLPEDQKKAKEEEYKKKLEEHTAAMTARAGAMKTWEADRKAQLAKAGDLSSALVAEDRGSKPFDEIVKAAGLEPKLSPSFTAEAPPEELKSEAGLIPAIFQAPAQAPQTVRLGNDGYALFEVAETAAPALLPLEEVKEKITAKLTADALAAAVKTAADTARKSIEEALKAGKTFTEAATAAGLTAVEVPSFTQAKPPTVPNASLIAQAAGTLPAGQVSEPVEVPEGLMLVSVLKRELPNDPKMAEEKQSLAKSRTEGIGGEGFLPSYSPLLEAWFNSRRNEISRIGTDGL